MQPRYGILLGAGLLATMLFAPGTAHAQQAKIERVDVMEAGIYSIVREGSAVAPGTAIGVVHDVKETLVEKTTRIEARLGAHFGFRYLIVGKPKTGTANLKFIGIYPQGITNPKTGNTTVRSEFSAAKPFGEKLYRGYTLDNDWEIVTGTWTFEIWDGDRKLASQSFELVKPQ
jgi:hypothetical protein